MDLAHHLLQIPAHLELFLYSTILRIFNYTFILLGMNEHKEKEQI